MNAEEQTINHFLRGMPGQWVSAREICRRADGRRRYNKEPHWAQPILVLMVEKGLIETDNQGHYRVEKRNKIQRRRTWLSPQMQRILERSRKPFDNVLVVDEDDD